MMTKIGNANGLLTGWLVAVIVISFMSPNCTVGQERYRLPPQEVVDIIDAPPTPSVSFSPDRKWMLLIERDAMPGIEDVARRMLQLAGLRIDPQANSRFATQFDKGILIGRTGQDTRTRIQLPQDGKLAFVNWSHNSDALAYGVVTDHGTDLWAARVDQPARLIAKNINTILQGPTWMPDGKSLLVLLVPEGRGDEPQPPAKPIGPNVQESFGNTSPTRTYQDLLKNPHDERLFDHYATNQLARVDLDGNVTRLGPPAVIAGFDPAPDGQHIMVTTIHRPYSYLLTYRSFPRTVEVWQLTEAKDTPIRRHTFAEIPLEENVPIEGVMTGPRNIHWMAGQPATLVWFEALDGGDPRKPAEFRDRMMMQADPVAGEPVEVTRLKNRAFGAQYFQTPGVFATTEYDRDRRWITTNVHDLSHPGQTPRTIDDRSIRDRYGDPGRLVTTRDSAGFNVVQQMGDWVYRIGRGASPKGDLPFVDRQNLKTMESERLWRCEEGTLETPIDIVIDDQQDAPSLITVAESPTTPPNYWLRNLSGGDRVALTDFKDPTPQIRGIKKQLVKYQRSDGVPLSATLYLPADYQEGQRLPLVVWAYPREFNDVSTAAQVSGSPNRFTQIRGISHLTLLTQGYAIMDNATMPVIGDPETMNDTFIEQIVDAAQAAIDKAVEMGVADPDRVGVGGHSYGAFMTANLLAHCDLFKAGIARSGAYNRTLTPFGFQSERRTLWEAKDVYFNISPFMHANKIKEPILLVHGENDNNSGTFPMQSRRMYQAIKGNGGNVRLVMLPYESHGYRARESVLHTQAEMIDWFDRFVKNAEQPAAPTENDADRP